MIDFLKGIYGVVNECEDRWDELFTYNLLAYDITLSDRRMSNGKMIMEGWVGGHFQVCLQSRIHPLLAPSSWMSRVIPSLPLCAFTTCYGVTFTFTIAPHARKDWETYQENFREDSQCPGQNSNREHLEQKLKERGDSLCSDLSVPVLNVVVN